jgi:hypothetical protein
MYKILSETFYNSKYLIILTAFIAFSSCSSNKHDITKDEYNQYLNDYKELSLIFDSIESMNFKIKCQYIVTNNKTQNAYYVISNFESDNSYKLNLLVEKNEVWFYLNFNQQNIRYIIDTNTVEPTLRFKFSRPRMIDFDDLRSSDLHTIRYRIHKFTNYMINNRQEKTLSFSNIDKTDLLLIYTRPDKIITYYGNKESVMTNDFE